MTETITPEDGSTIPERYAAIDKANEASFYMTDADRPFDVIMSLHGAGRPREQVQRADNEETKAHTFEETTFINERNKAARFVLAGNMSTVTQPDGKVPYGPSELSDEGRLEDAQNNMKRHFENIGVDPATVRVLNPERTYFESPLSIVNADDDDGIYDGNEPVKLRERGDFIYSYNPDIVLAVRPADCPVAIMSADTPKGKINIMLHFAWRGPAYGQFDDMKNELDALEVDYSTLEVYITPGGQAESYEITNFVPDDSKENPTPVEGDLFVGVKEHTDEASVTRYDFGIDTPYAVYNAFLKLGLNSSQVFLDTSNTTSLDSGYGSHSRAARQKEDNVRDIVTAQFHAK